MYLVISDSWIPLAAQLKGRQRVQKGTRATFSSLQRVDIASTPSVCFSVSIAMLVAVGGVGGFPIG